MSKLCLVWRVCIAFKRLWIPETCQTLMITNVIIIIITTVIIIVILTRIINFCPTENFQEQSEREKRKNKQTNIFRPGCRTSVSPGDPQMKKRGDHPETQTDMR